MPTIKLADGLGFVVETETPEDASITKYLKGNLSLNLRQTALNFQDTTLKEFPLSSVRTGLEVEQDVELGSEDTQLTLAAGVTAGFTVFKEQGQAVLPGRFGEQAVVAVGANEAWFAFDISPTLAAGLSAARGNLILGFEAGTQVTIANYRPFAVRNGEPKLGIALRDTVQAFSMPGDIDDLRIMSPGTVSSIEGKASLTFKAGSSLSIQPNPLASIDAPGVPGSINVKTGASVGVSASYTLSSDFELRVRKLDRQRLEFGYYKRSGREFKVAVRGSAGISVAAGDTDLATQILGAVSSDPKVDEEELRNAGLNDGQIAAIQNAVEAGVDRSLELSLAAQFSSLSDGSAAFLYAIDLNKLNEAGAAAVRLALDGDLTALTVPDEELPAGVKIQTSIFRTVRKKRSTLKINLLGIFNFVSVTSLAAAGEVLHNHETGELILTDKVTANRIRATAHNFAADPEKVRAVQSESFLFTAAYRGSKLAVTSPKLKSSHGYFELHARTNHQTLKDNLDVAEALGLLTARKKRELLGEANDFGRSTLLAETSYDDALLASAFLDAGENARPVEFYESAGREALKRLYQPGDRDDYRREPALDEVLWKKMKSAGSPQAVKALFPNLDDTQKDLVDSDYVVIVWWAKAMHELAEALVEVRQFFAVNPNPAPGDNTLGKLRKRFRKKVIAVAKTTKRQFGEPWGLLALDIATNQRASAEVLITGDKVAYENARKRSRGVAA